MLGNISWFEILMRRYNPVLYKTGRGYGYSHEDTEDLMQEVFINCFQNISRFENRSSFKTWLIRIMLNQCYHNAKKNTYKKRFASKTSLSENIELTFTSATYPDPGLSVINKELNKVIEAKLNELPVSYRIIFTLRELVGLSIAETAGLLEITDSNVKVRLSRAKIMLQKELKKIYTPEEIYEFNLIYCDKVVHEVMKKIINNSL